jgi:hypothetical protein
LANRLKNLPWLQPNPNNLPYCTLSDQDIRSFPNSLPNRMEWPFGNSPSKGKCIPFIDMRENEMIEFYTSKCVKKYAREVDRWLKPNPPVQVNQVMVRILFFHAFIDRSII